MFSTTLHICYVFYTTFETPVGTVWESKVDKDTWQTDNVAIFSVFYATFLPKQGQGRREEGCLALNIHILNIIMHSLESDISLDTHNGIFLTGSWHSCGIANWTNDMNDIGENRLRATPSYKMNLNVDPVSNNSSPWKNPCIQKAFFTIYPQKVTIKGEPPKNKTV